MATITNTGFWNERSVLITGATGFLGGWMARELLEQNAQITVLLRDQVPDCMLTRDRLIHRVRAVRGDLSDPALLRRILSEYEVDTVFHLAAQALVSVAKRDPIGTLETNVRGTWNLLEAARESGTQRIIVASSDKAYGVPKYLPYIEEHPLAGSYPYDCSKSCADLICQMYATTYRTPVCITRCGNLFGGGDLNFSRTIPGLLRSVFLNQPFLIRSDGNFVRDFLYVRDAVFGYLQLAENMNGEWSLIGEAFNFSLELRITVLEIIQRVLEILNREDLQPVIQNVATAEIREQHLSAEKARRILGWAPRYGLTRGLKDTAEWYATFFATQSGNLQPSHPMKLKAHEVNDAAKGFHRKELESTSTSV